MEPLTELSQEGAGGGEPPGDGPLWTAVFEYEACGEDELSLRPGDVVQVLSRDSHVSGDEGWWTGKIDQRVGIFPSNYVSSGVQGGGPELRARYPPPPAIQRKGARARAGGSAGPLCREGGSQGQARSCPPIAGLGWVWEGGRDRRNCRGGGHGRGSALPMSLGRGLARPFRGSCWKPVRPLRGKGRPIPVASGRGRPRAQLAAGWWGLRWPSVASGGAAASQAPGLGPSQPPVCSLAHPRSYSRCSSALLPSRPALRSLEGRARLGVAAFRRRREQFPIVKTCLSRG